MLVFVGTKKVLFRPWPPEPGARALGGAGRRPGEAVGVRGGEPGACWRVAGGGVGGAGLTGGERSASVSG